jgi:hypothetical protein
MFEGMTTTPEVDSDRFKTFGDNESRQQGSIWPRNALYASYKVFDEGEKPDRNRSITFRLLRGGSQG